MRSLLICHEDDPLNRVALPRWLASFTDLAGIVVLRETADRKRRRVTREIGRVGWLRFADVLAFRVYHTLRNATADCVWEARTIETLSAQYPPLPHTARTLLTASPNSEEAECFIRDLAVDIVVARCKVLLAERIFSLPAVGAFAMHPGICPQYRNAHGCFWALVSGDHDNVGMTLLKIDRGIDTGPVYGFFRCRPRVGKSHIVLQHRVVFDNLPGIAARLQEIAAGRACPIETGGRPSAEWGQPWLSSYLAWQMVKSRPRRTI